MTHLTILKSARNFSKDLERIKLISSKIDKKISEIRPNNDDDSIDNLSFEELQDLHKIAEISNFLLCKYSDKKEMKSILEYFSSLVSDVSESLEDIDDEVSELIISAEDSINKVKDMHSHISDKSEFEEKYHHGPEYCKHETSAINLTKFVTEVHTVEYQQNCQVNTA